MNIKHRTPEYVDDKSTEAQSMMSQRGEEHQQLLEMIRLLQERVSRLEQGCMLRDKYSSTEARDIHQEGGVQLSHMEHNKQFVNNRMSLIDKAV